MLEISVSQINLNSPGNGSEPESSLTFVLNLHNPTWFDLKVKFVVIDIYFNDSNIGRRYLYFGESPIHLRPYSTENLTFVVETFASPIVIFDSRKEFWRLDLRIILFTPLGREATLIRTIN